MVSSDLKLMHQIHMKELIQQEQQEKELMDCIRRGNILAAELVKKQVELNRIIARYESITGDQQLRERNKVSIIRMWREFHEKNSCRHHHKATSQAQL